MPVFEDIVSKWSTVFEINMRGRLRTRAITYKRGLFQGDAFSPLLFCLCLGPVSLDLSRLKILTVHAINRPVVNNLKFMDDIKLFARNQVELIEMIEHTKETSEAIGMELGPMKCATAVMEKGSFAKAKDIQIGPGDCIRNLLGDQAYQYLGLIQLLRTNRMMKQ